jgi:hypothetical protein
LFAYVRGNPLRWIDRFGLLWEYHVSSGALWHFPPGGGAAELIGSGYSGRGAGLNNSDLESVADLGPIPQGTWEIGPMYDSPTMGPNTMNLMPIEVPGYSWFVRDWDLFRIHGDNACGCQSASSGCIVLAPNIRTLIGGSGDNELRVVL